MESVLRVVSRIFTITFVDDGASSFLLRRIIISIVNNPYLFIGIVFVIVGFSVSLLKRIINS